MPLHEVLKRAIEHNNIPEMERIAPHVSKNDVDDATGIGYLHYAAVSGASRQVGRFLFEVIGCELDKRNLKDETPLHISVSRPATEFTEFLLDNGARIGLQTSYKKTAKELALKFKNYKDAELIEKAENVRLEKSIREAEMRREVKRALRGVAKEKKPMRNLPPTNLAHTPMKPRRLAMS